MLFQKLLPYNHAETITYISNYSSGSITTTSHTFTNVNFGEVFPNRRIVVVVGTAVNGTASGQQTSVTIGGVTATQLVVASSIATNTLQVAIYVATVPEGTTGSVVVNVNNAGTSGSRVIQVYSLNSAKTATVTGTDTSSPYQFTRTFNDGELYIGGGRVLSTGSETWTNATERIFTTVAGQQRISSATYAPATAGSRTITYSPSSTSGALMASVVFV